MFPPTTFVSSARRLGRAGFRCAAASLVVATVGCTAGRPPITPPPAALGLDSFYAKSLTVGGIPISASARVPDKALYRAAGIVRQMLSHRPDIARQLDSMHQRVVVMAASEGTVDLPEQRDWKKPGRDDPRLTFCERKHYDERIGRLSDRDYWNARARGMGGLLTSAAAENLLAVPGTRYYGETIFVHEFSHAILDAIEKADPVLYDAVAHAYADARARGLWRGEYIDTNVQEYWAEGTQFWFESNKLAVVDGTRILSAADLERHDPALAAVLRRMYGDRHHLKGDPFWRSPARVPPGPPPVSTAEVC